MKLSRSSALKRRIVQVSWLSGVALLSVFVACDGASPEEGCSDGRCASGGIDGAGGNPAAGGAPAGGGSGGTGGGTGGETQCSGFGTPAALAACVDTARLEADLVTIARPRPAGSPHHRTIRELCASRFEQYGYDVELHDYGSGVNVIGRLAGSDPTRGALVVSAHYDSIADCDGADDNASGVAGTLEAARVLSGGGFAADVVVACWDQEEPGLLGSRAYAERATERGELIDLAISLEMIGYTSDEPDSQGVPAGFDVLFPNAVAQIEADANRGRFIAFVIDESAASATAPLAHAADSLSLRNVVLEIPDDVRNTPAVSDLRRSDHASFWSEGYPAVMVTDTADYRNPNYHCFAANDAAEDLDFAFMRQVVAATVQGVASWASAD